MDCPERVTVLCHLAESKAVVSADDPWRVRLLEEALAVSRRIADLGGECDALCELALERCYSGDPEAAEALAEQATALAEQIHDPLRLSWCIHARGIAAQLRGHFSKAIERFTVARDLARACGDEAFAANDETFIATSLTDAGRLDEATQTMRRVAAIALRISQWRLSINTAAAGAHLCAALGATESAATLVGVNWGYLDRRGSDIDPTVEEQWMRRTGLADVRDALGQQKWEEALRVGSTLTLEDALALLA